MTEPVPPRLFLERRSYQNRRLIDALQLLPFLGALLWLLPLVWARSTSTGAEGIGVVQSSIYIFSVWAGLTVLSAVLVSRLPKTDDEPETEPERTDDDGAA